MDQKIGRKTDWKIGWRMDDGESRDQITGVWDMEKREEILKIENLKKSFGRTEVLKGINMTVYRNEIISVLGPSGCGKSTLLNIIAGMLTPDGGSVSVGGIKISERG